MSESPMSSSFPRDWETQNMCSIYQALSWMRNRTDTILSTLSTLSTLFPFYYFYIIFDYLHLAAPPGQQTQTIFLYSTLEIHLR